MCKVKSSNGRSATKKAGKENLWNHEPAKSLFSVKETKDV